MSNDSLFLNVATEAVLRAGEMQMAHFGTNIKVEKKGAINLVTEVDLEIETMFRQMILERFPDHDVMGEELESTSISRKNPAKYRWLFDPIDGTTNYVHGLPIFCSSLSLEVDGRQEIGAVYDPNRKELFTAMRNSGAWLNGIPLHVSNTATLLDSILCTGFPYDVHETLDEVVRLFGDFVGRVRAVRRLGSAALDLCYVAVGRLDGFWEQRLQPWDVAAGSLIVEEAGGRATQFDGSPFDAYSGQVVASNGQIHDDMMEVILSSDLSSSQRRMS